MASLSNAPNEITSHILEFIPRSGLPKLCLVNKAFRRNAEPILYSTISFTWTYHEEPPIIALLHSLLRRPELFAYIDTLSLQGSGFVGNGPPPPLKSSTVPDAIWEFVPTIKKLKMPFTDLWVEKLWAGSMDAVAALLIAYLSKTRRLAIAYNFVRQLDLVGKVLQAKAYGQLPKFERLQHLVYIHGTDYFMPAPEHRSKDALALLHLPTVTHLAVWMRNPDVFRWPTPAGAPNLDHLTSLDIEWCCAAFLAKILTLTRNLESLSWKWEYAPDTNDPWITTRLDFDLIIKTLSHVKTTLKRLQFRLAIHGGQTPDFQPEMTTWGSFDGLADFNQITELDVPLVSLAGLETEPQPLDRHIPRSVEVLSLSTGMLFDEENIWGPDMDDEDEWADDDVMKLLQDLVKTHSTRLPRLCRIHVVDDKNCFLTRRLDKMLEETPLAMPVEIIRSISPHWESYIT